MIDFEINKYAIGSDSFGNTLSVLTANQNLEAGQGFFSCLAFVEILKPLTPGAKQVILGRIIVNGLTTVPGAKG